LAQLRPYEGFFNVETCSILIKELENLRNKDFQLIMLGYINKKEVQRSNMQKKIPFIALKINE
jgi:hypothetical protein